MPKEFSKPRLIGDKVLVKVDAKPTFSGIEVIEKLSTLTTAMTGIVLAVGPGDTYNGEKRPVSVQPGQKILIPKWAGQTLDINGGEEYVILREVDILAIVE